MVPKVRNVNNAEIIIGECVNCGIKPISDFTVSSKQGDKVYYRNVCHICFLTKRKEYRKQNKHQNIAYRKNNREKLSAYNKQYYEANKEKYAELNGKNYTRYKEDGRVLQYRRKDVEKNKEKNNERAKKWQANKRKESVSHKLNSNISRAIRSFLTSNNGNKNGKSCRRYLPFTFEELKNRLESLFEPWMTWDNYGTYKSDIWNDDPATWTWNIDHIIPQSKLQYMSMEEENFKKCWALSNLRPYSSKQNLRDGNRR
jgi:hypothetical protein